MCLETSFKLNVIIGKVVDGFEYTDKTFEPISSPNYCKSRYIYSRSIICTSVQCIMEDCVIVIRAAS